jgi:malonyl-CoA/methylmalonyl-CoA synthetase
MPPYGRPISPITFSTAVTTIWSRMLEAYSSLSPRLQATGREAVSRQDLRLNISGSAALPKPIRDEWTALSGGNILLERYGMTEVGMALSCGLDDQDRIDGSVGWPLPSVQVRLVETDVTGIQTVIEHGQESDPFSGNERQGEIQLRGPTVFDGYWDDPVTTAKEFTQDGWFKTGDKDIPALGLRVQPTSFKEDKAPTSSRPVERKCQLSRSSERFSLYPKSKKLLYLVFHHKCGAKRLWP